jgi:hypothetical protein
VGASGFPADLEGGSARRSFSPAEKLRLLAGCETPVESGSGSAFLRGGTMARQDDEGL